MAINTRTSKYVVALTGASGSIYGIRLIEELLRSGGHIYFVASSTGEKVLAYETGFNLQGTNTKKQETLQKKFKSKNIEYVDPNDQFSIIASGSVPYDAMVIVPCSVNTIGCVATGVSQNVLHRAAAVCLKERRPLIIVPRETPISLITLRGLTTLTEAGAMILPAMPAFYTKPKSLSDAVDFVVGRILDQLHVAHKLYPRWKAE